MTAVKDMYSASLDLDDFEPKHLGFLLDRVSKHMRRDLKAAATQMGVTERFAPLTPAYFRLLSLIPAAGARVTDLARLADMTKQALGQFVDLLEDEGYVASAPLATDRRVRVISRTAKGDQAVEMTEQLYARVEARWREQVGPERWLQFRDMLTDFAVGW